MEQLQCYNKGCGKQYDPSSTTNDSCTYHPGVPVFHDALKGWSCCKKRSTDFTEFLNIPGCTTGSHSNEKQEPVKALVESQKEKVQQTEEIIKTKEYRKPLEKKEVLERPPVSSIKKDLKVIVGQTLVQALEKQIKEVSINQESTSSDQNDVKEGTSCKNNGCTASYKDESSNVEKCLYHPGVPIFHEGMKYWTCCKRKTSDFDNFLNQEGCTSGHHLWIKIEDPTKKVACRHDWHQTGSSVIISVFSKLAIPEKSWIKANPVALSIHIGFDGGNSVFEKDLVLCGIIDPDRSSVKMVGTKVEITMKKAEPGSWPSLELKTDHSENKSTES